MHKKTQIMAMMNTYHSKNHPQSKQIVPNAIPLRMEPAAAGSLITHATRAITKISGGKKTHGSIEPKKLFLPTFPNEKMGLLL